MNVDMFNGMYGSKITRTETENKMIELQRLIFGASLDVSHTTSFKSNLAVRIFFFD